MPSNNEPNFSIMVAKADLFASMARVNSVIERRKTIPILSNALIRASGESLEFVATDLDMEVTDIIAIDQIDKDGEITVPAQTLHDIARKLPSTATISLYVGDSGQMEIKSGRSSFTIPTLPSGDFPQMTSSSFDCNFSICAADFKEILDRTKFAVSTEVTRYYLNGIYFHIKDGNLVAVATDGHRLALSRIKAPAGSEEMQGVIVPRKTIAEIRRLIDGLPKDADLKISVSDTKIKFEIDNVKLVSKLIDGTFPDYDRVVPKSNPHKMVVNGADFRAAVDRVATISSEKSRSIVFDINAERLKIEANGTGGMGAAHEDMDTEYEGADLRIGFSSKYLTDTLMQIESNQAVFYFDSPASPALVLDPDSEGSLFVLMPLRV